ncbi:MAG TPA: D-amino acid aminotransferase [Longimicrobiales bacterium]|nr:D-amino acid aminotransferase [Longimicrobiales bacterium]
MLVYLNGKYVPHEDARISVDDRGFLFADGVYEVVRVYRGRLFRMGDHVERMRRGLDALRIGFDGVDGLGTIAERLLAENGLDEATVYIQVTRGASPRAHAFPTPTPAPTVYVATRPFGGYPPEYAEQGVTTITVPDTRWSRCDVKSVALLPNVLANQQAKEAGAFEALFVRDGVVIEGSLSNLLGVIDGTVVTYPACNYILPGITRAVTLELARALGIPVREGPIRLEELHRVEELFLSGTTTEVMPIARVDGRLIGDGRPGPITRRLREAFRELTA